MPFVNFKILREGVTAEQKAKLIKGATDLLTEVLGKPRQATSVVIFRDDPGVDLQRNRNAR